ncbi:MAG: DNA mismatch repair endonuclease MutL [Lachnospiraceae bacterium]|jgi:DNA mismatch repair protein MutL|uniref:DNA mismatch repair endonuclease MutL n=1 Tax=Clostridium sp. (strain SY8519) TaxID=1042156 RepID=UPI0002171E5D|nr:DNA mismatch repair endonuclease MutL [Clostridium sp. SY8519]MCI1654625.1 DNA mismatch repair endonuclease MutL [Lachnospiraceae bacterium]MCI1656888.1 DNA mismatch repair endonuclease MutL [Lachnospiraceae bacterium]MCI2195368.1 DNA mismatch repair endonuclease MutL [Lachnospiraceae bacterium]BAK48203.1 DNA mismatch repair enzyme [Clostridium sp. SY8519]
MPQIELLDQQTIDKIAAGEVVDRPSSVVKELVENAIDAGATAVTIEIQDGGSSMIRITDNGCGIEKEQISLAFCRHSTSKIRQAADLMEIHSLGFRGEALSSIAAVSQVELITKPTRQLIGCRYRIEGGQEKQLEEIGAPNGTTVFVRNLFYNTPARRKFLKTAKTEGGYVASLVEQLAFSHPEIAFKFLMNGRMKLHTSGNGELKDIIYQIYGRSIAGNLLPLSGTFEHFSVSGYIGKPLISRGNRNFETYFVNGRYIRSKLLAKAIEDGYHGFLMQHKFPLTVLHLSIDGRMVDVNVHPNKMEMRISGQEEIYRQISELVHHTLQQQELIPEVLPGGRDMPQDSRTAGASGAGTPAEEDTGTGTSAAEVLGADTSAAGNPETGTAAVKASGTGTSSAECPGTDLSASEKPREAERPRASAASPAHPGDTAPEPFEAHRLEQIRQSVAKDSPYEKKYEYHQETLKLGEGAGGEKLLSRQARPNYRILGQLFETYWLLEYNDHLYIVDQHAAHEKVLYERTMQAFQTRQFYAQLISPPMILDLTIQEQELMDRFHGYFEEMGFELEPFGDGAWAVRGIPANLFQLNGKELFLALIDELSDLPDSEAPAVVREKIASMSCKAAVKGNQNLSRPEAEKLLDELLTLENPYFCPHGRPVIISMSHYEIDKKFKRIL